MDLATVERWLVRAGFVCEAARDGAIRLVPPQGASGEPGAAEEDDAHELPPLYLQLTDNWLLLSMLPMVPAKAFVPEDVNHRLLAANRDMRLAKFALDDAGAVVLCAELPTESLDESELTSAVDRILVYGAEFDGGKGIL